MMFGKMSKHKYVDDNVLSNTVELFVSNRACIFAVSHMVVEGRYIILVCIYFFQGDVSLFKFEFDAGWMNLISESLEGLVLEVSILLTFALTDLLSFILPNGGAGHFPEPFPWVVSQLRLGKASTGKAMPRWKASQIGHHR
jgi:hypothetical protein